MVNFDEANCPCEGANLSKFVQPVILAILKKGDVKGYSIIKECENYITFSQAPDAAGIYRMLRTMEERALVEKRGTGEYHITKEGLSCLKSWKWTLLSYARQINQLVEELDV